MASASGHPDRGPGSVAHGARGAPTGALCSEPVYAAGPARAERGAGNWGGGGRRRLRARHHPRLGGKGYHLDYQPVPVAVRHGLVVQVVPLAPQARVVASPFADRLRLTGVMEVCDPDDARIARPRVE